jgi:hypothetical protein
VESRVRELRPLDGHSPADPWTRVEACPLPASVQLPLIVFGSKPL